MMSQVKLCPCLPRKPLPSPASMGPCLPTQSNAPVEEAAPLGGIQQGRATLWASRQRPESEAAMSQQKLGPTARSGRAAPGAALTTLPS